MVTSLTPGINILIFDPLVDRDRYDRGAPTEAELQARLAEFAQEINAQGGELIAVTSVEVQEDTSRRHPMIEGPAGSEPRLLLFVNNR